MLIAALADSRLEASCRYARSIEFREKQAEEERFLRETEEEMGNVGWWRTTAKKPLFVDGLYLLSSTPSPRPSASFMADLKALVKKYPTPHTPHAAVQAL